MSWKPLPAESYGSLAQRIHDGLNVGTWSYDCLDCPTCTYDKQLIDGEITSEVGPEELWTTPGAGGPNYCSRNAKFTKCPLYHEDPQKLAAAVLERLKNPPPNPFPWRTALSGMYVSIDSGLMVGISGMSVNMTGNFTTLSVNAPGGNIVGNQPKTWDGKQWI